MKLVKIGDERLSAVCKPVEVFDDALRDAFPQMEHLMTSANGVGLAAPQVGINARFFITKIDGDKVRVFVNPQITATSIETETKEEGCLSIPDFWADVTRPAKVTVQAQDAFGKPFVLNAKGLLARVIQHENDHLNGILFPDRVSEECRAEAERVQRRRAEKQKKLSEKRAKRRSR